MDYNDDFLLLKKTEEWIEPMKENANNIGILEEIINYRSHFRLLILNTVYEEDKPRPKTSGWSENEEK